MHHRHFPRAGALFASMMLWTALSGCDTPAPVHQKEAASSPRPQATPPAPAPTVSASPPAPTASAASSAPVLPLPPAPDPPIKLKAGGKRAVRGEAGLVTSVDENATRAGADVLRRGGNAMDAAVAVAFALAVTHPSAGNIGGGGFMIVRLAGGETHAVDFREMAPASATVEKNTEQLKAGAVGYLSAAVPGTVAGMSYVAEKFGTKPIAELVAPAIELARRHRVSDRLGLSLAWNWAKLKADPTARATYGNAQDKYKTPLKKGDTLRQPDLARTLEVIAKEGSRGFYEGAFAEKTDKAMRANGGLVTAADLKAYKIRQRAPLRFSYRGFTVDTMGPPSMGGIGFAEIMLLLERYRAHEAPADSGLSLHYYIEASKRAYSQRRRVGGDPDFVPPETIASGLSMLLDGDALQRLSPPVKPEMATPSSEIASAPGTPSGESPQTTHFAVVDAAGNAVSCTVTQSAAFGSKVIIPGTGVLLSNAMGAFSEAGVNTLVPGKRMSSSMSPSIVTQNGRLVLVLGSPGGDTIPGTVAQVFRNLVDYGMTIDEAIERGRAHHPWLPDKVRVEKQRSLPKAVLDDLARRGHVIEKEPWALGDAKGIVIDDSGVAWGYADSREGGKAEGISKKKK